MRKSAKSNVEDSLKEIDAIDGKRVPPIPRVVEEYIKTVVTHYRDGRWPRLTREQLIEAIIVQCEKQFGFTPTYHQIRDRAGVRRNR